MSLRCDKCHKVVTERDCVDWEWPTNWFRLGEETARHLARLGQIPIEPKKCTYHRVYGKRRPHQARGPEMLCGEVRKSHPDEEAFDHLLSLMGPR